MAKTEKSKAELYRQERKERIAGAAKKNSKRSRKHPNAGKIVGRVIGTVLVVAVIAGAAFGILKSAGVFARMQTAFTVGEDKISVAEYGYMYYMQYQQIVNSAQQSESQYGYNIYGFDYTKSPEEQDYPTANEDGSKKTWAEYITEATVDYVQEFYTLYNNAVAEGYETTEEDIKDIDESMDTMRETAANIGGNAEGAIQLSLNSYLKLYYGEGINANFLKDLMKKELIVQRYSEDKQQGFEDKYTDEIVDKEYNKDVSEYNAVDLRMYAFENETLEAAEGESEDELKARQEEANKALTAKAEALLANVTDEASFNEAAEAYIHEADADEAEVAEEATEETAEETAEEATEETATEDAEEAHDHDAETKNYGISKSSLTSYISEEASKWAFDSARKAGDKKVFTNDNGSYALYLVKPSYAQESVDVRHALFMTVDSSTGEELDSAAIKEKKALAEEVLAQWNDSEKTEEYFAELANEYSEDTGSNTTGGLYEKVTPGQMVDSFDKWIFDESRKAGDVEIIESEFGYHLMYFVGNKDFTYRSTIRTSHTQDDYSSWLEAELEKENVAVSKNEANMKKAYDRAYKLIEATVASINQSQSYSY